jgi:hypothetical protein
VWISHLEAILQNSHRNLVARCHSHVTSLMEMLLQWTNVLASFSINRVLDFQSFFSGVGHALPLSQKFCICFARDLIISNRHAESTPAAQANQHLKSIIPTRNKPFLLRNSADREAFHRLTIRFFTLAIIPRQRHEHRCMGSRLFATTRKIGGNSGTGIIWQQCIHGLF